MMCRWGPLVVVCSLVALMSGCSTPVASALEEPEANRVVLALDRAHVASTKEIDATNEGRFRVLVANEDAARALGALRAEELPRAKPLVIEGNKGSLVPSPVAEHAQLALSLAAQLERSLENVDGVLSARVHLNLPASDPFRDAPREKATASVLIAHRGTTPPISEAAVQRLIGGGAPGVVPAEVAVVMVPRASIPVDDGAMVRLGPFGVARASLRPIQLAFVGLLVLLAGLAVALAMVASRMNRLRSALDEAPRTRAASP